MPVAWGDARWALWTRRRPAKARGATLVLRSRGLLAGLAAALVDTFKEALAEDGPVLVDVRVTKEENCYPMIPAGQAARDMVG